jgi:hypothetical protein
MSCPLGMDISPRGGFDLHFCIIMCAS